MKQPEEYYLAQQEEAIVVPQTFRVGVAAVCALPHLHAKGRAAVHELLYRQAVARRHRDSLGDLCRAETHRLAGNEVGFRSSRCSAEFIQSPLDCGVPGCSARDDDLRRDLILGHMLDVGLSQGEYSIVGFLETLFQIFRAQIYVPTHHVEDEMLAVSHLDRTTSALLSVELFQ